MRRILAPVLIAILLTVSCFGISSELARTQRHQASHWIIALHYDDDGTRHAAGCSATAIGPHTLLTAAHCYIPNETLFIDASIGTVKSKTATEYHPTNFIFDLQDHMLIDVPGAHFTTYIPLANFRAPRQGEHFYFYGNPAGIQDQYREGYITGQVHMNPDDEGDVVAGSTMYMATGPVVGGDSGSSLYALDGTLIGIVTFGIEDGNFLGTFPIQFTAGQIVESAR